MFQATAPWIEQTKWKLKRHMSFNLRTAPRRLLESINLTKHQQMPPASCSLIFLSCLSNLVRLRCANIWELCSNSIPAILLTPHVNNDVLSNEFNPFMDSEASWWNFILFFFSSFPDVTSRFGEPAVWCGGKVHVPNWRDRGEVWQMRGRLPFAGACRLQVRNPHKDGCSDTTHDENCLQKWRRWAKEGQRHVPAKQSCCGHSLHKSSLFCSFFCHQTGPSLNLSN